VIGRQGLAGAGFLAGCWKSHPSHPPDPGGYFTHPTRVCRDSLFAQGRAFSHASFSPRNHPQRSPLGEQAVLAAWGGRVRRGVRLRCFHRLRPCWTAFLSILRDVLPSY